MNLVPLGSIPSLLSRQFCFFCTFLTWWSPFPCLSQRIHSTNSASRAWLSGCLPAPPPAPRSWTTAGRPGPGCRGETPAARSWRQSAPLQVGQHPGESAAGETPPDRVCWSRLMDGRRRVDGRGRDGDDPWPPLVGHPACRSFCPQRKQLPRSARVQATSTREEEFEEVPTQDVQLH